MNNHEFDPLSAEVTSSREFSSLPKEFSSGIRDAEEKTTVDSNASMVKSKIKRIMALCVSAVTVIIVTQASIHRSVDFQTQGDARIVDQSTVQLTAEQNQPGSIQAKQLLEPVDGRTLITFDFSIPSGEEPVNGIDLQFDRQHSGAGQSSNWGVLHLDAGGTDKIIFENSSTGEQSKMFVRGQLDDGSWHHVQLEISPEQLALTVDGTYVLGCAVQNEPDLLLTVTGSCPSMLSGLEINNAPARLLGTQLQSEQLPDLEMPLAKLQHYQERGKTSEKFFLVYSEDIDAAVNEELPEALTEKTEDFALGQPAEPEHPPVVELLDEETATQISDNYLEIYRTTVNEAIEKGELSDNIWYYWYNDDFTRVIVMRGSYTSSTVNLQSAYFGSITENGMNIQFVGILGNTARSDILDRAYIYRMYENETGQSIGTSTLHLGDGIDQIYFDGILYHYDGYSF